MTYILIVLSFVPFWAKPPKYIKEAEKAEANLNYKAGAYYYQKCLNKFPEYPGRDSVYLALINLHVKWGKDSLLLSTIETFCEEIPSSMLIPEAIYKKARFFDKELPPPIRIPEFKNGGFTGDTISIVDKRLADPIKAESLYKVVVEEYKESPFVEKAKERIKYLNEAISLPVGKVYKCEICGNVFKADKILKTKRKNRQKYLEKYSTTEIMKGRCYKHEIVKIRQKVIIKCPECGRIMKTETKDISCMRSEIEQHKRKEIKSYQRCYFCETVILNLGMDRETVRRKLGKPNEESKEVRREGHYYDYATPGNQKQGWITFYFSYSHYSGSYELRGVVCDIVVVGYVPHTNDPLATHIRGYSGQIMRKKGEWYYEVYRYGEKKWFLF